MLSLALLVILLPLTGSAEVAEPELSELYKDGFLIFGDSFGLGMGGTDNWDSLYYKDNIPGMPAYQDTNYTWITAKKECRNVEGGFSYLLAQKLGCNCPADITDQSGTYWPITHCAYTLGAAMDLLGVEDGFFDTLLFHNLEYCKNRYNADLYYFGTPESVSADGKGTYGETGVAADIRQLISKQKLIVVELGMGDIINRGYESGVFNDADSPLKIAKAVGNFIDLINEGFSYFKTYYPVFIDYLRELNPTATIVGLSSVNSFFGTTITESTLFPLGSTFSLVYSQINAMLKEMSEEKDFLYVDISNIETGVSENELDIAGVLADEMASTHPTKIGHQQICNLIIDALKEYNGITESSKKDIVIDIGRFDSVDLVKINGIPTKNYSIDGHNLTVHCYTMLATNLTITSRYNGKLALTTYQLAYHNGKYNVYRVYTTNNIGKARDNLLQAIRSFFGK